MTKKSLPLNATYPINLYPFEAFYNGSWCNVEQLRITGGILTAHISNHGSITEEKVPVSNLRIKSRKASKYDCSIFLRPGVDVCVLTNDPTDDPCKDIQELVWVDAKINSIERKSHDFRCTCRFHVSLNGALHHFSREKNIVNGETRKLQIEKIAILQQLDRKPCEGSYFRWTSSKDCPSLIEAKLSRGQFMYDVSWMLVGSSLKGVEFKISSEKNKILYQNLDGDPDVSGFGSGKIVKTINFKVEDDGVMRPHIIPLVPEVPLKMSDTGETIRSEPLIQIEEAALEDFSHYDTMCFRRSKRQKTQPDRFVSASFLKVESYMAQANPKGKIKEEEPESPYIILCDSDSERSIDSHSSERTGRNGCGRKTLETSEKTQKEYVNTASTNGGACVTYMPEHHKKGKSTTASKRSNDDQVLYGKTQESTCVSQKTDRRKTLPVTECDTLTPNTFSVDSLQSTREVVVLDEEEHAEIVLDQQEHVKNPNEHVGRISFEHVNSTSVQTKNTSKRKHVEMSKRKHVELVKRLKNTSSGKEFRSSINKCHFTSRKSVHHEGGSHRRTSVTRIDYKEIIEKYMENIESEMLKHPQAAVYQWEKIRSYQCWKLPQEPPSSAPVENPELEDLWKEMEMSIYSHQYLQENLTDAVGSVDKSNVDDGQTCQHEYVLNEQVGTICRFCSSVGTEIRYILPPLMERTRMQYLEYGRYKFESKEGDDLDMKLLDRPTFLRDNTVHNEKESVWALIPNLQNKMKAHQKSSFEFLWRNIAGSLIPAEISGSLERTGGCVISHSPGAGKTFLMISFLVSYLKLFPRNRPLIIAPKTILYTWCKEFKKWEVSIPVYQINARRNYISRDARASQGNFKLNQEILHTVDCLEKFEKWHKQPSVILMSYSFFLSIMRGVHTHSRYMARILAQSPGLLILDEGHNPRSTNSQLRKTLMQVKTEHRVLLSGTLFQNNFKEYFNTLCLARPSFVSEVLKALDPTLRRNRYAKGRLRNYKEKRARKLFIEKIGSRVNSKVDEERRRGLNMLKKITSNFIDVFDSGPSDSLPGLKSYTLLIKPSMMQQEYIAMLQKKDDSSKKYRLELELLITFLSIHPWLIRTIRYSDKYYDEEKMTALENYKLDVKKGSKVIFVVELIRRCIIKREKVLIFCRYIEPMKLFVKIFENIFGWSKGDQVLLLYGEQELFERSRVIDKFEEPGSPSQVLIASISACSEGISLTAASRVVFLDSEWNPSKIKQAVARAFRPGQEKVVHVYQLLAFGTMEEDKYGKNTWKERLSKMIFVGSCVENSSCPQPEKFDDEVLQEIMHEGCGQLIHMVTKNEQLSGPLVRGDEEGMLSL